MKTLTAASLATTLLLSTVMAQETYTIDPNNVANATREYWCTNQQAQCPLICLQQVNDASTIQNACDPNALTYACICSNGLSPNVSEYSQTLPFFLCQEWGNECVSNCGSDNTCQSNCRSQHLCGAQNPTRQNTSTLSKTMSQTASAGSADATTTGGVYTGFGNGGASSTGGAAASASSDSAAHHVRVAALNLGQTFGLLGVVGVLFGGFAVLL